MAPIKCGLKVNLNCISCLMLSDAVAHNRGLTVPKSRIYSYPFNYFIHPHGYPNRYGYACFYLLFIDRSLHVRDPGRCDGTGSSVLSLPLPLVGNWEGAVVQSAS
jgi:hypothetical protein